MNILIMCHGKQQRISLPYPKHLHVVADRPIIYRTIDFCRQAGFDDIFVVAPNDSHWQGAQRDRKFTLLSLEDPGHCVLAGIKLVEEHWENGATILLGDVIYSPPCLLTLLHSQKTLFVGTEDLSSSTGELFGVHISPDRVVEIKQAMDHLTCLKNPPVDPQGGHLRHLLWQLAGESSRKPNMRDTDLFVSTRSLWYSDYTLDLDSEDNFPRISEIEKRLDKTVFGLKFDVVPQRDELLACFYCGKFGTDLKFYGHSGNQVVSYGSCQLCFEKSEDRIWSHFHSPQGAH